MADGALAPSTPQSPLGTPGPAIPGSAGQPLPDLSAVVSAYPKKVSDIRKNEADTISKLEGERSSREIPKYVPPQQAPTKQTTPQEAWASSAMMLAVVASAVTRAPLTSAFNAAAAALKGFHEGDMEAFKNSTEQWKIATENAIELQNFQQQAYDKAMGDINRRETLAHKEADAAVHDAYAGILAISAQFKDTVMSDAAKTRDLATVERIHLARDKAVRDMQLNIPKVLQSADEARLAAELSQDPEFQRAQQAGDAKKMHEMGIEWGVITSKNDPFNDPKSRQQMILKYQNTPQGKAAAAATSANVAIQALAADPDIAKKPMAQLQLVDRFLYLATGSTRPGIAQYAKALQAQTYKDRLAILAGNPVYHPIIGPDQIRGIKEAAEQESKGVQKAFQAYLRQPATEYQAKKLGLLDGDDGMDHQPPPPHDIDLLKQKVAQDPAQKQKWIKFFDTTYGEGAAAAAGVK
jgi:hypothetical protein